MISYVILSWCFCWIWLWNWLVFELSVCEGFQLLCFRYLWTRVVITMWTPMYARYLWTTCEMDVTCGWSCWIMYDLGCMRVGLKSFVVSVDYQVYMGSSMTVWSLRWLLSYLCSYKLVSSVIATASDLLLLALGWWWCFACHGHDEQVDGWKVLMDRGGWIAY